MHPIRLARPAGWALMFAAATACAGAPSPWSVHERTADLKPRAADPAGACPVVFSNATDDLIEAGYVSLGVESSVGMIPSGHSLEISVSCSDERIEAFAVSEGGVLDRVVRYRKLARLNLARVTHLDITAADRIR